MRKKRLICISLIFMLSLTASKAQLNDQSVNQQNADAPTITITKMDINDTNLKLSYEIRNNSETDIWIFSGFGKTGVSAELFLAEDDQTLILRRQLDVPWNGGSGVILGRYLLIPSHQTLTESVSIPIPVYPEYRFADRRQSNSVEYATRLIIEIGYYDENLPGMIKKFIKKADIIDGKILNDARTVIR